VGGSEGSDADRHRQFVQLLQAARELPPACGEPRARWRELNGRHILLSAPHEEDHLRDGMPKASEGGTGPLAFAVARCVGGAALCTAGAQEGDPTWDAIHPYAERVHQLAAGCPVLDLHMMLPRVDGDNELDMCVGRGPDRTLADALWPAVVAEAVAADLRVAVDWPFSASKRTLTGTLQDRGLPALQVELSVTCFDPASPTMERAWTAVARAAYRIASERRADNQPRAAPTT